MSEFNDLEPGHAMLVDWTAREYHDDRECVSRSQLMDLRTSPALFHARHEARTLYTPETPAMLLGTYTHLAVLEPREWERRLYAPEPVRPYGANGRAKAGTIEKKLYVDWKADLATWEQGQSAGSIIVDFDDRTRITHMAAAVRSHPDARQMLDAPGSTEQTIVWRHPSGVLVRVRLDGLVTPDPETVVVLDLKTSKDPSPNAFGRSMAGLGYHRQGAMYVDAAQALHPDADVFYALVVVRSAPPYEVACYELGEDELDLGRVQYEHWLNELVRRRADDDWVADWQDGIRKITLPGWAYHEET